MRIKRPMRSRFPLVELVNSLTLRNNTRINAEISQTSHIRIGNDLEDQCAERRIILGRQFNGNVRLARLESLNRRDIRRRRQIIDHSIQQHLDALVLQG